MGYLLGKEVKHVLITETNLEAICQKYKTKKLILDNNTEANYITMNQPAQEPLPPELWAEKQDINIMGW